MTRDNRARGVLALLITVIALAGCGAASSYPASLKTAYLDPCKALAGASLCDCALSHIEARVSVQTFAAYKHAFDARETVHPSWLTNAPKGCPPPTRAVAGATRPATATARRPASEPDTSEVAQAVRRGRFRRRRVAAAACRQPAAGHWTCRVRFANGGTATVRAVWYGHAQELGLSLESAATSSR